jgi:hypothetical protein
MKVMKKNILKHDNYHTWMKNVSSLEMMMEHLRDEIYFYQHGTNKIFDITNTYYIGDKYFVEIKTHSSRNQNERLHRFLQYQIHQYPDLLRFLEENAKEKEPIPIQIRLTKKSFEPIIYIHKKSYSLIDFAVLVQNKTITPKHFI